MTTIPPRLFDLSDVLKSLIRQSRPPDAIYLSIPYFYSRSWTPYEHPWWYGFMGSMMRIVRCEQDFRSNTGILCMLQYEQDPNTRILVVDDDQLYHPYLLQRMLAISADIPGAMIGGQCYHRPGIPCWKHNKRGMCAVPNLVHTTYGILFQRRFFDAGIFNFDAAAKALQRGYPSNGPSSDYVITSCMLEDNVWWESHLARKGIPRVLLSTRFDLAFGHGALTSSEDKVGYHHFHFDRQDPHSTAAALDTCTDALALLWGPSLWSVRQRRVVATDLEEVSSLSSFVSSIPWWEADHVYAFLCSGRSFFQWRRDLRSHGGLDAQMHYIHLLENMANPSFVSEPFDPGAFVPAPILTKEDKKSMAHWKHILPARHTPGREAAGSRRPLVDVVELCPAPAETPPAARSALPRCGDFKARILHQTCQKEGHLEERVELIEASGFAGVACWAPQEYCFSAMLPRNRTWQINSESVAQCLPASATFYHARRLCEALDSVVPTPQQAVQCCRMGCLGLQRLWVASDVPPCYEAYDTPEPATNVSHRHGSRHVEPATRLSDREGLARSFLQQHEEASGTEIRWDWREEKSPGALTNVVGMTLAAGGYAVGKVSASVRNSLDPDAKQGVADSDIFQMAFGTWLRCNGIVPSVTYDPVPPVPGTEAFKPEDVKQTPIILCNHTCYLDGMVLASVFHGPKIIAMKGTLNVPVIGLFAQDIGVIEVDRADPKSRAATIKAIEDHVANWKPGRQPLLLFPEGTTSNGQGLLEFRKGAFVPGVPVRPAVLCYTGSWDPANTSYRETDGKIQAIEDTEWAEQFLGHMMHSVQIRVLPPYVPSEEEKADPLVFASNVRKVMGEAHAELRKEVELKGRPTTIQAIAQKGVDLVEDVTSGVTSGLTSLVKHTRDGALAVIGTQSPQSSPGGQEEFRRGVSGSLAARAAHNRERRHKTPASSLQASPASSPSSQRTV
ncbi:unnamed protein product [Cladocopium goreaui]|uniref:1-acylglycerophosphocholine O-acyltransferase 1 n=1 Tax=Cladocopium goreaui TaxID=2562237 RepID=A0A9P1CNF3_9DINO|nr:unnamed protein product [Cladocopium goreaui]